MRRGSRLTPARQEAIQKEILGAYARLAPNGAPIKCRPPEAEISYRSRHHLPPLRDKVIFDTDTKARDCASRLSLTLGIKMMRAYPCQRFGANHWHLTSNMQQRRRGAS